MLNPTGDKGWRSACRDLAIDHGGPTEVLFDHFDDDGIEAPIIDLFDQVVARHGDKLATVDEATKLTYRELQQASRHLARRIERLVPPGRPVGILLPNNALFPVAALACLGAERPYVPIDPSYPLARIAQIREEAGLSAMIIDRVDGEVLDPGGALPFLDIGTSLGETNEEPLSAIHADGPAVILYTSGSTGRPKGICNDQRAIVQRVAQATNSCHLNATDCFFLLSAPGTIAGVRETFAALLNGGTLYVADPNRLGINGVLQMLGNAGVTVGYIVPALLRQLFSAPQAKEAFHRLRVIRIGGDVPIREDLRLCRAILPASCRILFAFSSTEVPTIFQWFVPPDWEPDAVRLPIGNARPGMDFRIEDDGCGDGAGELVVRSRYLALGYWQNGQLQNGPFQTDPLEPGVRILRTGDRVRLRADSLVEMTGRIDRQIKMRGSRIDLAEIEAALRGSPDVADAAVIPRSQDEDVTALVAYVVPHGNPRPTLEGDLRAMLANQLPRRMCPAHFRFLDMLPQLRGFKTDYQTLATFDRGELSYLGHSEPVAIKSRPPATPKNTRVHNAVAKAWATIVGPESFEENLPWNEAGGDSLALLHLWMMIEEALGTSLVFTSLELNATPGELVVEIERQLGPRAVAPLSRAPRVFFLPSADGDTPLQAQFRAAFHNQIRFEVVQYPPWREMIRAGADFGVLAAAAVDQIMTASDGDVLLAGFSFGGFVAVEVARRLIALNRRVTFVGLIDTLLGLHIERPQTSSTKALSLARKIFRDPASLEVTVLKYLTRKSAFGILQRLGELAVRLPAEAAFRFYYHLNYHLRVQALYRWAPQPVDAPTYLFRTNEFPLSAAHCWEPFAKPLEIISVGGMHFTILRPPAREELCQQFLRAVNAARSKSEAPAVVPAA
jgi:acyl-CoA synthetase (AMP-forming)/AMP-acid ligase II/thioesterase domain-containing protein/acyl carrier protein